nr:phage-related minor tail protein [uncultured Mediterranean phage uvMED]
MNGNAKFSVLLGAKVTGENNIKRLGNSMQGVQGKAKNLGMAVKGVGTAFKALFAAAAIAGFSRLVTGAIDSADAFGKLSTRTGIAANKLQAYANAGKLADVSQSDLETGLRTLARTQAEAADGVATYSEAYAKLGVGVKKADGSLKPSDKLLGEIADKFKDLPNGPEKAAIAMDVFGRSGSKLITLLNGGSEALERFNYETSENFAQNAEYFNDQIAVLQIRFDGFRKQLADALLPALNAILEVFSDLFESGQDFTPLFQVIEAGVRGVASVILGLVQSMRFFTRTIQDLVKIATLVASGKFGQAFDLAKTGLSDTRTQFFKDIEAQGKVLFGTSEVGADYGGGRTGGFTPVTIDSEDSTGEQATSQRNSALSKGLDITLKQTASFAKMLQGLKDEERLLQAKILGKEKEVALDIKVEEMTRGLTPEIAAGVEQRIRGNAALQDTIDKTKDLNTNTEKTNALFESIKTTVATGLNDAIMGLIDGTKSLGDSLSGVLRQMASLFLRAGIGSFGSGGEPGTGLLGLFAKGGVFAQNNVVPFAYGGVVNKPTLFPMANGMGLMGEAGAEAIMPLRRGRGGRLGVESAGGGATNVNVSVDASGSSVEGNGDQAAQLGKAIGIAVQQELIKQKRPGGLLTS